MSGLADPVGAVRLVLPTDAAERARLLPARDHPAKAQLALLDVLVRQYTQPGDLLLDPLAGSGSLALAALGGRDVLLGELEGQFVAQCQANAAAVCARWACTGTVAVFRADARALPLPAGCISCILTSPPYGSLATRRRAAEPASARRLQAPEWVRKRQDAGFHVDSYGDHPLQIGRLRWDAYLEAMEEVYVEAVRVLRPGGRLVLITADFFRGGQRVDLRGTTRRLCEHAGLVRVGWWQRDRARHLTPWQRIRQRQGLAVVLDEDIQVFWKAEVAAR